jgi:hypothetical protein
MIRVFLPLMSARDHKFFAISSAKNGTIFTRLTCLKNDDGTPWFNSTTLGEACDACKWSGTEVTCTHNSLTLPNWKDPEAMDMLHMTFEKIGYGDEYNAEMLSITSNGDYSVFRPDLTNFLFQVPRPVSKGLLNAVYVSIDPAGGGVSEFAVVAIAHVVDAVPYQVSRGILSSLPPTSSLPPPPFFSHPLPPPAPQSEAGSGRGGGIIFFHFKGGSLGSSKAGNSGG